MRIWFWALSLAVCSAVQADTSVKWDSPAVGTAVTGRVVLPAQTDGAFPVVVYLKRLSIPRIGHATDEQIVREFVADGLLVLELDYAKHPKAVGPLLAADVLKLRRDIAERRLLAEQKIDLARVFILPEGFRLQRDVEFARDEDRVLAMDVMHPADCPTPVPALIEFSCDNANRMGTGSLVFCHDTLLEGGMFAGFAVAMADHPVRPPYKGIDDPMPDVVFRLKAAVRTLRASGKEFGLNGRIGAMGFSRGSNMAALLATTNGIAELEGDPGPHAGVSSDVQAALAHGARFDYARLRADDPMLARFEKAWGPRNVNADRWLSHGAAHYLGRGKTPAPMFLNTSNTEAPEFREGLSVFAERLKEAGVEHVYQEDADQRGHRVSADPKTLESIYTFFEKSLRE